MKNISKGLILEGIPGVGKSTLLEKLKEDVNQHIKAPSSFIFAEEITQRVLEKDFNNGKTDKSHHVELLEDIISPLENYQERLFKRGFDDLQFFYILERFHLTHASYYSYLSWEDFKDIDKRLENLGAKLCLLRMEPEVFIERIIHRRGAFWKRYLSRYGKTEREIKNHYIKQQKDIEKLAEKTNLPFLLLDTTQKDWENLYEEIKAFMGKE